MKVSKIVLVLAIALAVASIAVPAGAWFGPFGGIGCGIPFAGCGFGVPLGVAGGASFQSSFVASSSFNTFGTAGLGCGLGGFGLGGFGCGLGGFGLGGCGFGSPFGFC
ncbi:MAG TPA: hypothetical protein VGJ92_06635 [Methanocella sp.]|jgi:hypothetical protein